MKHIYSYFAGALALTFGLAACIPGPAPEPTPAPAQQTASTPAPAPQPAPPPSVPTNWIDQPQTQGDWSYTDEAGEKFALFNGSNGSLKAIILCIPGSGELSIGIFGPTPSFGNAPLVTRVLTETSERTLSLSKKPGMHAGLRSASLPAKDPLFDAIALTRGRFVLAARGQEPLYLPAWAEVTRVIEDCR